MHEKLLEFEVEARALEIPGLVAEFTFRMDSDPDVYVETVIFESRAAFRALAESPEQDARYRLLADMFEGEPEWHDGEVINTDFGQSAG